MYHRPMTETVDLVNGEGHVVKRAVPRQDAGRYEGLYLSIVIVVIFNGIGQILIHRRSLSKDVNPGDIDHVCGAVVSGETPHQAAHRETREELGVSLRSLHVLHRGINPYDRYRYLFMGETNESPRRDEIDPAEVDWVGYEHPAALIAKRESGELTFIDGFFDDLDVALRFFAERRAPQAVPVPGALDSRPSSSIRTRDGATRWGAPDVTAASIVHDRLHNDVFTGR